jgi:hypothetical protein
MNIKLFLFIILLFIIGLLLHKLHKIRIKNETFQSKSNSNGKISVLILNYNRPHNLEKSLPLLSKYKLIDEIIVSHGHPDYYKEFNYPKVKNIKDYKNNEIYGCGRRWFTAANNMKNDIVVILDDDIIPSEKLINKTYNILMVNYTKNTIYGNLKRLCDKNGYKVNVNDNYNTILTGYSMCKKQILQNYVKYGFKKYKKWLIENRGNCEDLAFNNFISKYYNEKGVYIDGKITELDRTNGYSAKSDHIKIRNDFCKKFN